MRFLVDPALAPLLVAAALALGRIDDALRGGNLRRNLLVCTGNAWYTVGPAMVLALAGVDAPPWRTGRSTCSRSLRNPWATPRAVIAVLDRPAPATAAQLLELASYGGSGGARETGDPNRLLSVQVQQLL